MIREAALGFAVFLVVSPAMAQEQQAGNEASRDTDGTFQSIVDQCDDTDALMLRARIRLQLPRTTDAAAAEAQKMLDEAFATCGGGDVDAAKAQLTEALALAEAGVAEELQQLEAAEQAAEAAQAAAETSGAAPEDSAADDAKPWWQFW